LVKVPDSTVFFTPRPFQDLHATWQPRQPMQRVRSTNTLFGMS
jgi:hypothetical protein